MKLKWLLFLMAVLCHTLSTDAQVGINTSGNAPDSSAMLDITSTDKGVLIPRMTTAERELIQNPATALLVYDTDEGSFWYYENNQWREIVGDVVGFHSEDGVTNSVNNDDDFVFGADSLNYASGSESLFFFDKGKSAFRSGLIISNNWDTDSLGTFSFAGGLDTKASGSSSAAFGQFTIASGDFSTATGFRTKADGRFAFASGNFNTASGDGAMAHGIGNTVSGDFSIAVGGNLNVSDTYSASFGFFNNVLGSQSFAAGTNITVNNAFSFASGVSTTTNGQGANVMGGSSVANGDYSNAFGLRLTAASFAETAIGSFNTFYTPNDTAAFNGNDRLFVIGNGTSDSTLSDALRIYKNGNAELNGALTIDDAYTLPVVDGTNGQVLATDGNGNVDWVDDATDNLGNHTATQNVRLSDNWLSNDGGNEGIKIEDDGDVQLGGDLIMGLNSININGNNTAITFFDRSPTDYEIFMAWPLIPDLGIRMNGSWLSNDGGNEGIFVATDGNVSTSGNISAQGTLAGQNSLSITNGNQDVTLLADDANRRVILDVGGSGASSDAFIIGDLTAGVNEVLMLGNVGIGTFTTPQKLTVGAQGDGTKAIANEWDTWSDRRLKRNFQEIAHPLQKLEALNGYYYHWTKDKADQSRQVGVIAQEVEAVLPEIVTENNNGYKSVDYTKLTALLIEVNQAQQKQIDQLNTRVKQLEAMQHQLQAQISTATSSTRSFNQK